MGARDPRAGIRRMSDYDPHARASTGSLPPQGAQCAPWGGPAARMSRSSSPRVLPVLLPAAERLARNALREREVGARWWLQSSPGFALLVAFAFGCCIAQAEAS